MNVVITAGSVRVASSPMAPFTSGWPLNPNSRRTINTPSVTAPKLALASTSDTLDGQRRVA